MTGRHADVIQAGYIASEIAHRMVVPEGGGGEGGGGRKREEGGEGVRARGEDGRGRRKGESE